MTTLATASARGASAARPTAWSGVAGYAVLDLKRQLRDTMGMFFTIGLPAFMYLVFGQGSQDNAGNGNVAMWVMISMAAYGAVTATASVAGSATTEQNMGWGRQLALTPLPPLRFVAAKAAVAMTVAGLAVALIFALGGLTGARGDLSAWLGAAAIIWLGSAVFAIYGLAICLIFRGPSSAGIASGLIVIMAFLGNLFTPMSGLILEIGRFTPLYGYAGLARYPLAQGYLPDGGRDSVWLLGANVLAWTVLFTLLAVWGMRRGRERV